MFIIEELYSNEAFARINITRNDFVDFLHEHLDRFRDDKIAINKCIDYAFSTSKGMGGFALAAFNNGEMIGALVMNKTGMSGYIPDNILVYVAVHEKTRGKGFGKEICMKAINLASGDVKLHVEYDNPAKRLYERLGFTTKYAEMRFIKK